MFVNYCSEKDNETFLSMMERYFALSDGVRDARPEYQYQIGKAHIPGYIYIYIYKHSFLFDL